jgi:murein DD-endopeptidase MepM/ murein hydrolase activator NlpD
MKKALLILFLIVTLTGCRQFSQLDTEPNIDTAASVVFQFPLEEYVVFREFGNINRSFGLRFHTAEDASGEGGTPVYAIADGMISYSGPLGGYGWLITIDHPADDIYSLYGHLSTRRDKITEGQVYKGDLIAYLADDDEDGSDGYNPDWGPHLHFGIRTGRRSDYPGGSGDFRWSAGYTYVYPTELEWLDPSDYINDRSR